ncbi:MAG: rod shape-determining protein MreC [Lutibacter sp.]
MLFLLLEIIGFSLTIQFKNFQQSAITNSSNAIVGGIYNRFDAISNYLNLKTENERLSEENTLLKNYIELTLHDSVQHKIFDKQLAKSKYQYIPAKIINNNFTKLNNVLTINKGLQKGIKSEMGVINSKGIIGVIKKVSKHYATVLSILNSYSKINAKLKNSAHFGTLTWNGVSYNTVQLVDLPRQAKIKVGDTIMTGGKSAIFPEGINIGIIKNFVFKNNEYQKINISLFNDMSNVNFVEVIANFEKEEQQKLENNTVNE